MRLVFASLVALAAFSGACGTGRPPEDASRATLRTPIAGAADPTLHPARLVPVTPGDDDKTFGAEPGGGKRMLVSGVRIIRLAGGGVESATEPLPAPPSATVEVPERLGGGFLFAIGPVIWRADTWLSPLKMIYAVPQAPTQVFIGLDRAYVRLANNAYTAFDAQTGAPIDLGPWPGSPNVTRYAAADGWRAVAIADLRGAIATFDAGGKWQALNLPIQPKDLHVVGDAIVVTGVDASNVQQAFAVQPNGQVAHLQEEERHVRKAKSDNPDEARRASKNPLLAAVLDGWPLEGGTALIARDGALTRVRMSDGAVIDSAPDAFPLKPARCHPFSLSPPKAPTAFGFVCGVPHGATEIYAYDARTGSLPLLRHFDTPRAVFSPANGTLVIEGACNPAAVAVDIKKTEQTYCLMRRGAVFEDFVVNGDVGTERVVPLADGRTAILSPPVSDLATARLTVFDGKRPKTIPIVFDTTNNAPKPHPRRHDDDDEEEDEHGPSDENSIVTAVLRSGTWLRGVEERSPGVLSAWVEHSGRYVGVEVEVSGKAKHGPYIANLGTAVVSGRYGLGWTASRQGYETTNGGMTWKPLALPEPLESAGPSAGATSHGCGPLGCALVGWIRVGWGGTDDTQSSSSPPSLFQTTYSVPSPPTLALRCEMNGKPALPGLDATTNQTNYSYYGYYGRYSYYGGNRAPVTVDWQPFYTLDAPKLGTDDLGFSKRSDEVFDHGTDRNNNGTQLRLDKLARLYAWGPKGIEWDVHGRFMVRFTSPFESSSALHVTQTTTIPRFITDATQFVALGGPPPHPLQTFTMVAGDDASHALLILHRGYGYQGNDTLLVELEAERPVVEVHRLDGQPLGELESAVRMSGRWYVATNQGFTTSIWEVENGTAREVAHIPRVGEGNARAGAVHLAKRADGRMIAALVDGAPVAQGASRPSRWLDETWAVPIDVDSGLIHDPESLGPRDGGGKTVKVCGPQDGGWVIDGKWPGGVINASGASGAQLHGYTNNTIFARYHMTQATLCVEKLSMTGYNEPTTEGARGKVDGPFADVGLFVDRARQALRCVGTP